ATIPDHAPAEDADTTRSLPAAPAPVEPTRISHASDQSSGEIELVDVAAARRVVSVHRRAPCVGDEDPVTDRLDPERRVPAGDRGVGECATTNDAPPPRVDHEHACVVEVGRVQTAAREREPA